MVMKNVTIALDDETHRLARIRAAELGTSLSALVKAICRGSPMAALRQIRRSAGVQEMQTPYSPAPAAGVRAAEKAAAARRDAGADPHGGRFR